MGAWNYEIFTNDTALDFLAYIADYIEEFVRKEINSSKKGKKKSKKFDLPAREKIGFDDNFTYSEVRYGTIYAGLRYILISGELPDYIGLYPDHENYARIKTCFEWLKQFGYIDRKVWLEKAKKDLFPAWWYLDDNLEGYFDKEKRKCNIKMLKSDIDTLLNPLRKESDRRIMEDFERRMMEQFGDSGRL